MMTWKRISIRGDPTVYEMSIDGHVRIITTNRLVEPKCLGNIETVSLFHQHKAICIDLEALYVATFS